MSENVLIKLISIKDFSKICRTCFGEENLFPLFELIVDNVKGTDLLENSANLQANRGDNLPENICERCLIELVKIYKFKRQCNENDTMLRLLIKKHSEYDHDNVKIENEEIDPLSETNAHEIPKVVDNNDNETSVHNEERAHSCHLCNKVFSKRQLRLHMRSHTKEQRFSALGSFKRHKIVLAGKQCGKQFSRSHQCKIRDRAYKYNCEQCGKAFKILGCFTAHIKKHASPGKSESTMPDLAQEYVCEICGHVSKSKAVLQSHLLTHGEKKLICDKCGKGFRTNAALHSHRVIHTGERPHKCTLCDKSFAHRGVFDRHLLSHSGYKAFKCNECLKTFALRQHLMRHMRIHTGEKPYECKFCGKGFTLNCNLKVHVRIHTGERPHVCRVCKMGFCDASTLKRHVVRKHGKEAIEKDGQED